MATHFYKGDKLFPAGTYDDATGELLKDVNGKPVPQNPHNGRPIRPTDDKVVNATAKAGLLANMEAALNEAREHERRAVEAENAVRRVNDRELVNHYSAKAREHRAFAELARSRAKSFRDAANKLS